MKFLKIVYSFVFVTLGIFSINVSAQTKNANIPIKALKSMTAAEENEQDVKLIFKVDAHHFSNGQLALPNNLPNARPDPIFEDINIWQYPMNLRRSYRENLGLLSLKEKTNYTGTCEQFISDKATLTYYQGKVEGIVRHYLRKKPQQEILVRLICIRGENINNKYRITSGNQNIMMYDVENNAWHDKPITRALNKHEIDLLESIDFGKNFDAIGRHPIPENHETSGIRQAKE